MKKLISVLLCLAMAFSLVACGNGEGTSGGSKEVELTEANITEYLNFEISSSSNGRNVVNQPLMKQTITVYPVQGGTFNNVVIYINCYGINKHWELLTKNSNVEQCQEEGSNWEGITYMKIVLPADGNYTESIECVGHSGLAQVPEAGHGNDRFDAKGDNKFTSGQIEAFEMFNEDTCVVSGTFVPN